MIYIAKTSGATGAKVLGAGGGGFLLVYCEPEHHHNLISNMSKYIELDFQFEEKGTHIIYNG